MQELVGGNAFRLALELQRLHRLDLDGVAHQLVRRLPDQDLTGGRRLFQPGGNVDGVAGHEPLAGGDVARDDLAGIDPGAVLQTDAVVLLEPFVDHLEGFAHLHGRPNRAQGVVLMQPWQPEDGHDRVADVLLDRPAVSDEDGAHGLEVDREDLAESLAVQALAERGGALQVAEDDRDDAAVLLRWRLGLERCAAVPAQSEPVGILFTARRTPQHTPSVRPVLNPPAATRRAGSTAWSVRPRSRDLGRGLRSFRACSRRARRS